MRGRFELISMTDASTNLLLNNMRRAKSINEDVSKYSTEIVIFEEGQAQYTYILKNGNFMAVKSY